MREIQFELPFVGLELLRREHLVKEALHRFLGRGYSLYANKFAVNAKSGGGAGAKMHVGSLFFHRLLHQPDQGPGGPGCRFVRIERDFAYFLLHEASLSHQ